MTSVPLRLAGLAVGCALMSAIGVARDAPQRQAPQGRLAPDFAATTLDGQPWRLEDQRGKIVLLDFWGTWCPPCRVAAPDLVGVHDRYSKQPFQLVGISSDPSSSAGLLREFLWEHRIKWPQIHDASQDIAQKYAVFTYPTYVVIDADGVQRARFEGQRGIRSADALLRQLLKGLAVPQSGAKAVIPSPVSIPAPTPKPQPPVGGPASPALTSMLNRSAAYLEAYEQQMSMVVAEEVYVQRSSASAGGATHTRRLKSDILVVDLGSAGWTGFRDVFEVDGRPVRDHQNRLLDLVTTASPDPLTQARRLAAEGARFNIGAVARTINMPTVALKFLRSANRHRAHWQAGGGKRIDDRATIEVAFAEVAMPRLIETSDQAPARGRFWIEESTGRIVRTELAIDTAGVEAIVTTTFGAAENLAMWVPLRLEEQYRRSADRIFESDPSRADADADARAAGWGPGARIDGQATYGKFRTFTVTSNTVIKRN